MKQLQITRDRVIEKMKSINIKYVFFVLLLLSGFFFNSNNALAYLTFDCTGDTVNETLSYDHQEDAYSAAWAKVLELMANKPSDYNIRYCPGSAGYRVAWVYSPYSYKWDYVFFESCQNDDIDGDYVCNSQDNCPEDLNVDQADSDGDGWGDLCDACINDPTDTDGDGVPDCNEDCPDNAELTDYGPCDCDSTDRDGDKVYDCVDDCPENPNQQHVTDENGCQEDLDFGINPSESCEFQIKKKMQGNPINIINGNNFEAEEDIVFNSPFSNKFRFKRYYNSRSERPSVFGSGWSHSYSVSFITIPDSALGHITDETGRGIYFEQDPSSGDYIGSYNEKSKVKIENIEDSVYVWYRHDGLRYGFNSNSQLIWIKDSSDNTQKISYRHDHQNLIDTVTDVASGRMIVFNYVNIFDPTNPDNSVLRLQFITGPASDKVLDGKFVSYKYNFDYSNHRFRFGEVIYADGSGFYYGYKDTGDRYILDIKKDHSGNKLSEWDYDDLDRATACNTRNGKSVDIDYITYAADNKIEVTDAYGVPRVHTIDNSSGQKQITNTTSPSTGCTSCGEDIVRIEYDTNSTDSRIIEVEYTNGRIDNFDDFDGEGNPRKVLLASGYTVDDIPKEREITRTYGYPENHPGLRLLLTQREKSVLDESKEKITTWDYDDDYNDIPNQNPTHLLRQLIEEGYTRNSSGTYIPYKYVTNFIINQTVNLNSLTALDPAIKTKFISLMIWSGICRPLLMKTMISPVIY